MQDRAGVTKNTFVRKLDHPLFTRSRVKYRVPSNSINTGLEHLRCRISIVAFTANMVDSKVRP